MDTLEQVQCRAIKIIKALKHHLYEEKPKELGLFSLEKRKVRATLSICIST